MAAIERAVDRSDGLVGFDGVVVVHAASLLLEDGEVIVK